MERRLTTIVAADLVGYSRLVSNNEEAVITRFRDLRRDLIVPTISSAQGRVIKTMGDGFLVEFPSPRAALHTAVFLQHAMYEREGAIPSETRLMFRIGINYGEVIVDGDDVLGDVVNIAARLESIAPPGGVCISEAVYTEVADASDTRLVPLGPQYVKNIPAPVNAWNALIKGVDASPTKPARRSERPSIAVLAFENNSDDDEQRFLADGIAEDVIVQLSRFRSLFVIARNSAFSYRNTHKDVREIARELGVRYVVEGSVRRGGDRLRVSAHLVEAKTGGHIWSGRWDRTVSDLFDLQDELTHAIVSELAPELGANERSLARRKPTENLTAWELCQKGLAEFYNYSEESYPAAARLFKAAIDADPEFALPYALLGRWHSVMVTTGRSVDIPNDVQQGLINASKAIELDDRLEDGHVALGSLLTLMRQETQAKDSLGRAYALNDNNPVMYHARTMFYLYQVEPDTHAMEKSAQTALALNPKDPLAWAFHFMIGTARWMRNLENLRPDVKEAIDAACASVQVDYFPLMIGAVLYVRLNDLDQAKYLLERAMGRRPALTLKMWHTAFPFPSWPRMIKSIEPELEKLVEIGLPRE